MDPEINPALNPELDRAQEEIEIARSLIAHGGPEHNDAAIGRLDVAIRYLQGVRGSLVFDQAGPDYPAGTILGALSGKQLAASGWTPGDAPEQLDDDQDDVDDVEPAAGDPLPLVPPQFKPGPEQMLRLSLQGVML